MVLRDLLNGTEYIRAYGDSRIRSLPGNREAETGHK